MLTFLLNNSIVLIFISTIFFLALLESKQLMQRKGISKIEFYSQFRERSRDFVTLILLKLVTAIALTITISMLSFRQFWLNDVFHVTFFTLLLLRQFEKGIKFLFDPPTHP